MQEYTYEALKLLAKQRGRKVTDYVALAPQNDQFYTGSPGEKALAEWFSDLWYKFGYVGNVHIRRVHYQIVSQDPPITPDTSSSLTPVLLWTAKTPSPLSTRKSTPTSRS